MLWRQLKIEKNWMGILPNYRRYWLDLWLLFVVVFHICFVFFAAGDQDSAGNVEHCDRTIPDADSDHRSLAAAQRRFDARATVAAFARLHRNGGRYHRILRLFQGLHCSFCIVRNRQQCTGYARKIAILKKYNETLTQSLSQSQSNWKNKSQNCKIEKLEKKFNWWSYQKFRSKLVKIFKNSSQHWLKLVKW